MDLIAAKNETSGALETLLSRNGKLLVANGDDAVSSATLVSKATNATGSTWQAFDSQACDRLDIYNDTGVDIEWSYSPGSASLKVKIAAGGGHKVPGITNANQVMIRRVDQSNTPVTVVASAQVG